MNKPNAPVEVEMATVNCKCDHCNCSLDGFEKIFVWNEHFGCSRRHVQLAQAATNRLYSTPEEKETDLL